LRRFPPLFLFLLLRQAISVPLRCVGSVRVRSTLYPPGFGANRASRCAMATEERR
jgi:hypothetical protein